jgi:flagellar motor protein MotB
MRIARMGLRTSLLGALVSFIAIGCQNKMAAENRALWEQNREQQAKIDALAAAPKADDAQVAALKQQIAEKDAKLTEIQSAPTEPVAEDSLTPAPKTTSGVKTSYDKVAGKTTVAVPGDVLFGPGDATIRDTAKPTLDKLALSLKKEYAGKPLKIEGHTDADPIHYSKWKSNQELSAARAEAVKAYLVKKGVPASLITTQGLGAEKAVKGQDKASERRVDIVVAMR